MKTKGFTLIEILATVIILSIVLLIAIPITLNIIDNSKKRSFIASSIVISDDIKNSIVQDIINGNNTSLKDDKTIFLDDEIRNRLSIGDNYQGYIDLSDYNEVTANFKYTLYLSDTKAKLAICGKTAEEVTVNDVYNTSNCNLVISGVQIKTIDNKDVPNKVMVNESLDLKALFNDSTINDDEKKVKWELLTSDNTIATISDPSSLTPKITFNNYGDVIIKLTSLINNGENRVHVTVYPEITDLNILKKDNTEINNTNVNTGETINLIANFEPLEANMHDVTWSITSGSEFINVTETDDNELEVKALKLGSVTVKAVNDLTGLSKEVTFNIIDGTAPVFTKCEVTNVTPTSRTLSIIVSDEGGSGYYRTLKPDGTYSTSESFTYDVTITNAYSFTAYDNAGNSAVCSISINISPANVPVLATGMTPIKWSGNRLVDTTLTDPLWYDYSTTNKKWANARTADGSMWVWIPRYAYQITSGYHTSTAGTIEVKFLNGTSNTTFDGTTAAAVNQGNNPGSNTRYVTHPAFKFGDDEIEGIWVMKFEASNNSGKIQSVPNKMAWRNQTISTMFDLSRSMETNAVYGWGTSGNGIDTHMLKDVEWGAASYLSWSTYGKNAEVWINNSNAYLTGCAGTSVSVSYYNGCNFSYNAVGIRNASTTGNYYGIYDMSGSATEYTASYLRDAANLTSYGSSLLAVDSKYVDKYNGGSATNQTNYDLNAGYYGNAIYETSSQGSSEYSWNSDISNFANNISLYSGPFSHRGGYYSLGVNAGVFYFSSSVGYGDTLLSWRTSLVVKEGL